MKFAKLMMAAAVAAGTLFIVTGCGESPTTAFQNYLKALKNGDVATVNKYMGSPAPSLTTNDLARLEKEETERASGNIDNMSVEKEEIKGDMATLTFKDGDKRRLTKINGVWVNKDREVEEYWKKIQADISKLKEIGWALKMYAGDHSEKFPDDLSALLAGGYLKDTSVFISSFDGKRQPALDKTVAESNLSFAYLGKGVTENFSPDYPLAFTKPDLVVRHPLADEDARLIMACYADGSGRNVLRRFKKTPTCREIAEFLADRGELVDKDKKILFANADAFDAAMNKK